MTTEEQTSNMPRDRHGLILEYLRTVGVVLASLGAALGGVTGVVAALVK
ncbi:hypothetical protein JNW90_12330 [Micromonospora sp. STR1s_5]|nr:hypothetical protein [Micromonospora sp. STR1s_5]